MALDNLRASTGDQGTGIDAISDQYVAQTKVGVSEHLSQRTRNQMKATFEAAKVTGRQPYFHFEQEPSQVIVKRISDYEQRYGLKAIIDTKSF